MVDRAARDRYAELLRHFAAGNVVNEDYLDEAHQILRDSRGDPALGPIFSAAWYLYDDLRIHRLRGKHALSADGRRAVARWVLFLHSDLEYEWPLRSMVSLASLVLRICTLGLAGFILGPLNGRRLRRAGAWERWPFLREADYQAAAARPWLLGGRPAKD